MKYYKDNNNEVYAFEEDGSQDDIIPKTLTPITPAEKDTLLAPTPEQLLKEEEEADKRELERLDLESIRDIREWIALQPNAPVKIKDKEEQAKSIRSKMKRQK